MRKVHLPFIPVFLIVSFISACSGPSGQEQANAGKETSSGLVDSALNESFNRYKEAFVSDLWRMYPTWASYEGFHKYDSVLHIPDEARRKKQLAFCDEAMKELKKHEINQLTDHNKIDYYLIENHLKSTKWSVNKFKSGEWNPSSYNLGGAFYQVINYKQQPLETRMRNIYKKLREVPAYYKAARENIKNPTLEHTELAIQQIEGSKEVFDNTLRDSLRHAGFPEHEYHMAETALNNALAAIDDFRSWLKDDLLPRLEKEGGRSFRIGKELYEDKFGYSIQSEFKAAEIYRKALEAKKKRHTRMAEIADGLWGKYFPHQDKPADSLEMIRRVIDTLSYRHVHRDSFISAIKRQIPQLVDFIKEKDIIFLDPDKPLVVRATPKYMRGVAGASISAPGPYDMEAETFYNVTPLDHYTEEEAESYLREYNHYILQILNIHEAIPGHYTQLIYSNQSPSIIKSILGNGAMIEGWAVYTERMMLEEGYGGNEPEMWLMYCKWNLRTICNTILDYSVHVKGMEKEEAMKLLVEQAFQEKSEAEGKWRRVTLTQVQLCSYFAGYHEIYRFREQLKKKLGDDFDLKAFHEDFLSYGSAPVKYIRQLMLEELKQKENKK